MYLLQSLECVIIIVTCSCVTYVLGCHAAQDCNTALHQAERPLLPMGTAQSYIELHQLSQWLAARCARCPWIPLWCGALLGNQHCRALTIWRPRCYALHCPQCASELGQRSTCCGDLVLRAQIRVRPLSVVCSWHVSKHAGSERCAVNKTSYFWMLIWGGFHVCVPRYWQVRICVDHRPSPLVQRPLLPATAPLASQRGGTALTAHAAQPRHVPQQHHVPASGWV